MVSDMSMSSLNTSKNRILLCARSTDTDIGMSCITSIIISIHLMLRGSSIQIIASFDLPHTGTVTVSANCTCTCMRTCICTRVIRVEVEF